MYYKIKFYIIKLNQATTIGRYKWELIILLWLAFFLNQADRQIFNVVLSLIKKDLHFTDAQLGLISSALIWTYGLMVPLAGLARDSINRKKIIVFSLLFWSTATMFTGLSTLLWQFILIRGIATGGGEAFYAPTANALISEYHHKTRAFAMSLHQTALYAGIILSGFLAGYIGEHYGWRFAFYLFGGFGIILSVIMYFRLRNPVAATLLPVPNQPSVWQVFPLFFRKPTALLLSIAFAGMVFVNVGYLTWMPTFLVEKFNLSLTNAGFSSMFYHHTTAFLGVLAGGWLADRRAVKRPQLRLIFQAVGLLLGAPFIYWMGSATEEWQVYLALAGFGFFRGIYDSNIFASLYEVIAPQYRSSATGLMLMFAFLTGAFAPYLLGKLKPTLGLSAGLSLLSLSYLFASLCLGIAVLFFFQKDRYREISAPLAQAGKG